MVVRRALVATHADAEALQPAVGDKVGLPQHKQLAGLRLSQRPPAQHVVLVVEEVKVELLAQLGSLAEALIAEVGDIIEQPAVEPANKPDLDRVHTTGLGVIAGVTEVQGELGTTIQIEGGELNFLAEQGQQCLTNGQADAFPVERDGHGMAPEGRNGG